MASQIKSRGFTIVELLIVIVIIAILAAITIVAYNGITARAHSDAEQSAAQNIAYKAEAYNAEWGVYPATFSLLTDNTKSGQSYYIPATSFTQLSVAPTAASAALHDNSVAMQLCKSGTLIIGLKIAYWNFTSGSLAYSTAGAAGGTCGPTYVAS